MQVASPITMFPTSCKTTDGLKIIVKINQELELLSDNILDFQKIPAQFRKILDSYIREFKFNETELKVNQYYDKVLKDINRFHRRINNFEYKINFF